MFNLLPENLKNKIKAEYKRRRLVVILFLAVCVEGSFLIFIFPTWLVSYHNEKGVVYESEQMNNLFKNSNINPTNSVIKSLNSRLGILDTALEYPKFRPFVDTVISNKTSSISITEFSYESTATSSATFVLSGVSSSRESLVSYVKRLEGTKLFKKVDLPIGNLAKDKNIEFTINLTI